MDIMSDVLIKETITTFADVTTTITTKTSTFNVPDYLR